MSLAVRLRLSVSVSSLQVALVRLTAPEGLFTQANFNLVTQNNLLLVRNV